MAQAVSIPSGPSVESLIEAGVPLDPEQAHQAHWQGGLLRFPLSGMSEGLRANAFYFNVAAWASEYLNHLHRGASFRSRWRAAIGSWDRKLVVDVGCGPGNVLATLGGRPRLIVGVDVAAVSLAMARELGYLPIQADAHQLPLRSGCADVVVLNAALHHCERMEQVLAEAARLVKPGGLLVTDHDHQLSGGAYRGLAWLLWRARLPLFRLLRRGAHADAFQQRCMLASELHAAIPGRGVTPELFRQTLEPLGFQVRLLPHNHGGAEVLSGTMGRPPLGIRLLQRLSGIDPDTPAGAMTLMCVARRR
jgi:SAM-dependent methyltransferase